MSSSSTHAAFGAPAGGVPTLTVNLLSEFPTYALDVAGTDAWALLSMTAGPAAEAQERPPVDLAIALDVSGSMGGEKLELAKKTLEFIINNMRAKDRLGLVSYDTNVYVLFPVMNMTADNKARAQEIVAGVREGSSTNLCGGMLAAIEMLRGSRAQVASVMLMTDGLANQGVTQTQAILDEVTRVRATMVEMFTLYTFGFGADHNVELLRSLSEMGQGMYYFVNDAARIPENIADCFGGLLTTVAQQLAVTLTAAEGVAIRRVHTAAAVTISPDGRTAMFTLRDMQADESRDLPIELALPVTRDAPQIQAALTCRVQYQDVAAGAVATVTGTLPITVGTGGGAPNPVLQRHRFRVMCAAAIEQARNLADRGNFDAASEALKPIQKMLSRSAADDLLSKELLQNVEECSRMVKSRHEYAQRGSHFMSNVAQSHMVQRSNACDQSRSAYTTASKAAYQMSSKGAF